MNTAQSVKVDAPYSYELLEGAAVCFIKRYFRNQGRWLVAACVVNVIGFATALALGAKGGLLIALVAFIAASGPLYCAYLLTLFPKSYAKRYALLLAPSVPVSFTPATIEISARGGESRIPWASIKEVWECPASYLLVFSPLIVAFFVVPKAGLPAEAYESLAQRVRKDAA
jgi:hypothetical protein